MAIPAFPARCVGPFILAAIAVSSCSAARPPTQVVTDGRFDDWRGVPVLADDDPADALPGAAVDLGSVLVQDDPRFLHLAVDVGRAVNAQAMRGTVRILFDGDGDETTGSTIGGLPGVDAILELSRMDGIAPGGYGAGVGVRGVSTRGVHDIVAGYAVGALIAPTHSAARLEIRLARGTSVDGGPPLFSAASLRVRLQYEVGGEVGDETDVGAYRFRTAASGQAPAGSTMPPKGDGGLRVVQWNAASDGFRDRPEPYNRTLAALDPDVILLDEIYGDVSEDDLRRFLATPPLGDRGPWHVVLGRGGGRQKAAVAARRPVRPEPRLANVEYAPGAIDSLERLVDDPRLRRLFGLERERGVSAAGGWVETPAGEVLFVALDLQSAGYDGSGQDRLRELQAATVRGRVEAALGTAGPAAAVVVAGDLNLVGSIRPLAVLREGSAGRPPRLAPADAYRLGDRSQATWRSESPERFTPGRLDFILFDETLLAADQAFVFDVNEVSADWRERLGLDRGDVVAPSDHLPVVADIRAR